MELLDSRRLTGPNLLWERAGAVIDVRFGDADAERLIQEKLEELLKESKK